MAGATRELAEMECAKGRQWGLSHFDPIAFSTLS